MRDTELYRYLLGLKEPWSVSQVGLDVSGQRVDIWVEHPKGRLWPCPVCQKQEALYDHSEERVWRHLDSCQFQTFLHARPPRVKCSEHGVKQISLPWAEANSRFTLLFEKFAIDVLCRTSIQAAAMILRISWDEAWHLMDRAVKRGLACKVPREIKTIGVDEKSAGMGQNNYITVISDLERGTVEEVTEGRDSLSLEGYFRSLTPRQLVAVEAVSMDMARPYISAVEKTWENGREKIVFDRFHLMGHVGKAVDTVRRQEHLELKKSGASLLTGTRYIWLYARENLPMRYWDQFWRLRDSDLKTARAWAIKEGIRRLWSYRSATWAEKYWKWWYFWATHSRLEPIKQAAKTLKNHLYGIMNFFQHRITNAKAEGLNSRIETMWKTACGFRNKTRMRIAILFHFGGLNLYPVTH